MVENPTTNNQLVIFDLKYLIYMQSNNFNSKFFCFSDDNNLVLSKAAIRGSGVI